MGKRLGLTSLIIVSAVLTLAVTAVNGIVAYQAQRSKDDSAAEAAASAAEAKDAQLKLLAAAEN
jgi:hypothetical protein